MKHGGLSVTASIWKICMEQIGDVYKRQVLSGTDLECGSSYKALVESAKKGLISEKDIDVSVKRLLKTLRLEGQLKFAVSFQLQSLQLGLQFFIIIIK